MNPQKQFGIILSLTGIVFIDSMGFGLIFPILSPLLMDPIHGMLGSHVTASMRDVYFGLVLGIFAVFMFISSPILGDFADQIGRKKMLLFSLFGTAITSIICAIGIDMKSMALLLIGRAAAGLCGASQSIAQAAMADLSSGKERTKNLGLIGAAGSVGFIIGPIVGGYFSDSAFSHWFNYSTPFYIDALIALLNAIILYFTFQETYISKRKLMLNFMKGVQTFTQAFARKDIRKLSVILLLLELTFALYFQFIGLYLMAQFHFTSSRLGLFMSLSGAIFAVTLGLLMRFIIKLSDEANIVIWGLLITIIGYLLPLLLKTELMQWIALFPIIIGIGVAYNPLLALFSLSVTEHEQGWVMGVTSCVMAMAWILGAFGASLFFYIDPNLPFIMAILFLIIATYYATSVSSARTKLDSPSPH